MKKKILVYFIIFTLSLFLFINILDCSAEEIPTEEVPTQEVEEMPTEEPENNDEEENDEKFTSSSD